MRLVFMGTPEFAVPFLEALQARHQVSLVVTQPDKPKGRGMKLAAPPVKEKALALGLPVAQPVSLKTPEFHDLIKAQAADLLVVVAYRILPATLFPLARFGAVNVHGSLLPKYRGAAPIQWAIANGEKETGVTVFQLDAEIDHGQVLARARTPIGPEETSADLFARLRELGRDTLLQALDDLEAGRSRTETQDHSASTPAPKLKKEDGKLDFALPAQALHDRVRAFNPYPVCYAAQAGSARVLRVHATRPVDEPPAATESAEPGTVRIGTDRYPYVATGRGWLMLREVQWEGKPRVSGPDFVNGLQPAERENFRLS
ncbi:MAG: methionyl-tRNA formyltransferase [Fibrobacteres bacterium]|nr:methionyl-tRNA formyltransferase [Fibrobacterota bacterium]